MTYAEKLKDPRWQKRRLEILNRDNFTCQSCLETEKTLHVHHKDYMSGAEPWEYEDKYLVTLCVDCHKKEKGYMQKMERELLRGFRINITDSFVQKCAVDLFTTHPDLHRLIYLLWEYRKRDEIMQFLEDIHSETFQTLLTKHNFKFECQESEP